MIFLHTLYFAGGGGGVPLIFSLFPHLFHCIFFFGYLTWPRYRDPFFIFTIVMFKGGVGDTLHTPRIYFS
jgi:hypothetical protein